MKTDAIDEVLSAWARPLEVQVARLQEARGQITDLIDKNVWYAEEVSRLRSELKRCEAARDYAVDRWSDNLQTALLTQDELQEVKRSRDEWRRLYHARVANAAT